MTLNGSDIFGEADFTQADESGWDAINTLDALMKVNTVRVDGGMRHSAYSKDTGQGRGR